MGRIILSSSPLMKEWSNASMSAMVDNIYQYSHAFYLPIFTSSYINYMSSFVNPLIIIRQTKRCILVSNWSFVLFVSEWTTYGHIFWASNDTVSWMYLIYHNISLFSLRSPCNLCFENVIVDILLLYSRSSTEKKQ